jgi:hypothetical protein
MIVIVFGKRQNTLTKIDQFNINVGLGWQNAQKLSCSVRILGEIELVYRSGRIHLRWRASWGAMTIEAPAVQMGYDLGNTPYVVRLTLRDGCLFTRSQQACQKQATTYNECAPMEVF